MQAGSVSVITIFLNAEAFLEEAVRSVLNQTYERWELLLVDDGSTDGSTALALGYAERHADRIRYIEHPGHENRGMSASRNLGIGHARGEYIALLDADDVWLPEKLERQVERLVRHPDAAMTYGPTLLWYGWTGSARDVARDTVTRPPVRADRVVGGATILARILAQRASPVYTCSILARRDAVLGVGGFEDEFRGLFEDQVFFSKFLLAHRVHIAHDCLDRYRQHTDSCCGGVGDDTAEAPAARAARLRYLQWLAAYLDGRAAPRAVRSALAAELWLLRHPAMARLRGLTRSLTARLYGGIVTLAFAFARLVIPRRIRRRLWHAVVPTPRS